MFLNVSYADVSDAQKLDLYLPETGNGPFPIIVFIHGGAFIWGDKADRQAQTFLKYGLQHSFAVASFNYRLAGESFFPAGICDVKAAIRFLRANATKYHLDTNRFVAAGASSGANYACIVCTTSPGSGDRPELDDLSLGHAECSSAVHACVSWYAPTDLSRMKEHLSTCGFTPYFGANDLTDLVVARYLGGQAALMQAADPAMYVHSGMPPVLLQHGRRDRVVPWQQSAVLAERIAKVAGKEKVQLDIIEEAGHGDEMFETEKNMARVFRFVDDVFMS